jgi:hypothetical protein
MLQQRVGEGRQVLVEIVGIIFFKKISLDMFVEISYHHD